MYDFYATYSYGIQERLIRVQIYNNLEYFQYKKH